MLVCFVRCYRPRHCWGNDDEPVSKDRGLDKILFTNERQLRLAVKEYLEYWNHYRPHAGLNGNIVLPYQQDVDEIQEISFLGGLLHGYRRIKQAA